jgi:hypothetical protein
MSIRVGNSCVNCENLSTNEICKVHGVKVSTSYTCDSFEMKAALKNDPNLIGHLKMLKPSLIMLF